MLGSFQIPKPVSTSMATMPPDPTTWRHRGAAAGYKNGDVNFKYTSNGYRILPETDKDWPPDGSPAPQCFKVHHDINGSSVVYDQHNAVFDLCPNPRQGITPYHAELIEQGLRLPENNRIAKILAASEDAAGSSQVTGPAVEANAAGEAMAMDEAAPTDGANAGERANGAVVASPAGEAAPAQDATPADEATPGNGAAAAQQANATANVATVAAPATRRPFSRSPLGELKPVRLTQLPNNVTNEEIMTFFPRSMGRAEVLSRVMDRYRFNDIAMYVNGAHGNPDSIAGPVIESSSIRHAAKKTKDPSKFGPWKLPPGGAADVLLTDLVRGVVNLPPKGKGDGRLTKILRRVHFFPPGATLGSIMPLVEGQDKLDAASLRKYARQLVNNGY